LGGREFPQEPGENGVADELLVKLAPGARIEDIKALVPALAKVMQLHPALRHFYLQLPPGLAKAPRKNNLSSVVVTATLPEAANSGSVPSR
jgi:hypothetical protein